jgi:hypothetical protein
MLEVEGEPVDKIARKELRSKFVLGLHLASIIAER